MADNAQRTNPGSEESTIASVTNAALEALRSEVERHRAFTDWLIAMDEPGSGQRRTVTLTMIIERAKDVRRS